MPERTKMGSSCCNIVFVLTTSDADADKRAAYAHNVAGYLVKGDMGLEFEKLTGLLESYRGTVEFPPPPTVH